LPHYRHRHYHSSFPTRRSSDLQRPLQIFSVEPTAYGHYGDRGLDVRQVFRDVLRLPVLVVIAVPHPLVPDADMVVEIRRVLAGRSEEHTSELQSQSNLVRRLLL